LLSSFFFLSHFFFLFSPLFSLKCLPFFLISYDPCPNRTTWSNWIAQNPFLTPHFSILHAVLFYSAHSLYPEDGDSRFLQNVGTCLSGYILAAYVMLVTCSAHSLTLKMEAVHSSAMTVTCTSLQGDISQKIPSCAWRP
jgi:hypothetical protein